MTTDSAWTITNTHHDASSLAQHNSVFTVSNGYLSLKGNLPEARDGPCPVTLINGVYDEIDQFGTLRASKHERRYLDPDHFDSAGPSPAVANLPNPLAVRVFVGDREVSLGRGAVSGFAQSLDMQSGVYACAYDFRDASGRTTRIETQRFAPLTHAHRVFMRYAATPVDHDAPIRILSGIDSNVHSNTTRQRQVDVCDARVESPQRCVLNARTPARKHDVHLAVQHVCRGAAPTSEPRGIVEHDAVYWSYEFAPSGGQAAVLERCVVLTCSEDGRHGVAVDLEGELTAATRQGFDGALAEQRATWQKLWERADVQIDGDERAQRYLRFCIYHLLAAAPRHSDRLSVPVKLLTGEYYQGNTFWDTDLYLVPFYTFTFPELARTCLNYRHKGLTHGRAIAAELGLPGAKFAWQAGPYGEECLGRWYRFVHTNIHINADVVYSLMQYYRATGDDGFLQERGIDILVETARFYHSRAVVDVERGGRALENVAGPDEGHCESVNNFYTNYLAIRNLRWAADALARLTKTDPEVFRRVAMRLRLEDDEPARWRETADGLILLFDPQTKLYEQCEGFFQLPPAPNDLLENRRDWFVTVFPYQALNQPDVVMALTLFRDEFDAEVWRANWEYYKAKSMDFSSMSFVINAIAATEVGELDEAYRNFIISAGADLDQDLTGRQDTYAGLHGTALGGAWMAAAFGFGGVSLSEHGLRIDPKLPPQWQRLGFNLVLHGAVVRVEIDRREILLTAGQEHEFEMPVLVTGQRHVLRSGKAVRVAYAT
jgi:kojibiose phosphorylase